MKTLKTRIFLVLAMLALALGAGMVTADEMIAGGGGGVWAEVCCGSGCSPAAYCTGDGSYTCCR
jgi:hypothetical protein